MRSLGEDSIGNTLRDSHLNLIYKEEGDLVALLKSQDDLSTLLELVGLVDGLADTLSKASNITIFAPTNQAFAVVPRNIPEGQAIEFKNDTIAIGALLANHVFEGVYPSKFITNIPTFAQTLLDGSYVNEIQPFSNFTRGAYNELVRNGKDVCVISGEQTISTVTAADIMLGEGITIHKIDTVMSFGAPLQLFTYRSGYFAMNTALEASKLQLDIGLVASEQGLNISDYTIFIPTDEAFKSIGSVLASASLKTLQEVLKYHIIPNNVIFSTSLGNATVPSLQGADFTFTVLPDGSAWVNNARIVYPNTILFNGAAHVIDTVLAPGPFNRSSLKPSAPASERLAFPSATPVLSLPFSSLAFAGDLMTYTTTPELLKTVAAVVTASAIATTTMVSGMASTTATGKPAQFTGTGNRLYPAVMGAAGGAFGVAALLV
ncbi:FAS1 domain-containing protein [Clohesyomyces aquaticus]|uniref:FAS1 domain-containing protein n=1 Tax=Clohesyomyces aquaticus TaxID=1231657 RepID=A0A1Y1ZEV7_9PLEO|nr:FAS1 domain-containing protein [Clohesyomyces aquaticus]